MAPGNNDCNAPVPAGDAGDDDYFGQTAPLCSTTYATRLANFLRYAMQRGYLSPLRITRAEPAAT